MDHPFVDLCANFPSVDFHSRLQPADAAYHLQIRPTSSLSTSSSPGLDKTWNSPSGQRAHHPSQPPTHSNEKEKGKGLVKWLKNTFNGCSRSHDKENDGG